MKPHEFYNQLSSSIKNAAAQIAEEEIANASRRVESRLRDVAANLGITFQDSMQSAAVGQQLSVVVTIDLRGLTQ